MADFHEIRTARQHDGSLTRRCFQCLALPQVTVFAWQDAERVVQLQLLYDEQFVEWRAGHGLRSGRLQRETERGVRSLLADGGADLDVARRMLAAHTFPDDVVAPLREALG